jgi:pimeloyl-ACP methyl ester carboxylesterase
VSLRSRASTLAVVLTLGLAAGACSGGGGSSAKSADDLGLGAGETVLQFEGAGKLHMGGTLAMPDKAAKPGPTPATLIVPTVARNDRNGYIDVVPGDPLYQDLSKAIAASGTAVFRYDRRGMGVSKLDEGRQVTFDDMVTDAENAVSFLAQRSGIDANGLSLLGHDIGGIIALRVAAMDNRIKSVVLVSTPGRPLVDIMADNFLATNGQESADAFRATIATLLGTGALPDRLSIRPEHQTALPSGQDNLLKAVYSLDPVAEAAKVKVPTLIVTGTRSTTVNATDAARLAAALTGSLVASADTTASLQTIVPALPQAFDPNDHRAHGGGAPSDTATRNQPALDQITAFMNSKVVGSRQ